MVLYGSAVTGEFVAEHSDLNIVCIVEQAGAREIEQLHPAAQWWVRAGNSAPIIFTLEELRNSADVFAIELLDMKQRHRMLLGQDFLGSFEVSPQLHRLQMSSSLQKPWLLLLLTSGPSRFVCRCASSASRASSKRSQSNQADGRRRDKLLPARSS